MYWSVIFPLDFVRTRVIAHPTITIREEVSKVYQKLGVRGFYAGLGPTVFRAFFTNATFMTTFNLLRTADVTEIKT